jgi:twitching motility protein PilT
MSLLYTLMDRTLRLGGSDLHVRAGARPRIRLQGELVYAHEAEGPMNRRQTERILLPLLEPDQRRALRAKGSLDFAYRDRTGVQWRMHFFRHLHGLGASLRPLSAAPPTLAELRLPALLERFTTLQGGVVVVAGPAGSGKTTTLAALIGLINRGYHKSIVTVESPIEFEHPSDSSMVHQREVGQDVPSVEVGIEDTLRSRPDVLVVGELASVETLRLILEAADSGVLVFTTVNALDACQAIERLVEALPLDERELYQEKLAHGLRGVISQVLLHEAESKARVVACEILFGGPALATLIREDKLNEIRTCIQSHKEQGMLLLDDSLATLLDAGLVTRTEAERYAVEPRWLPAGSRPREQALLDVPAERRQKRLITHNLVSVAILDPEGATVQTFMGRTEDLSPKGTKITADVGVKVGATVRLTLAMEEQVVQFEAKVRSSEIEGDRHALGLEFERLPADSARALDEFLTLRQ